MTFLAQLQDKKHKKKKNVHYYTSGYMFFRVIFRGWGGVCLTTKALTRPTPLIFHDSGPSYQCKKKWEKR